MRNLTKAQAVAAYRKVCASLGETPHPEVVEQGMTWPGGPVLCRDFGFLSVTRWAVVWEEGPWEWALGLGPDTSKAVFVEPVTTWALGLYPS